MDLHAVTGELYGLLPEDFAATRKVRAGEAQAAGHRDLAAAIRHLRRPTTSAWLANLLVRERPTQIAQLLELGTALHRAQADLAGEEMRRLSQRRQEVVRELSDAARRLARDLGKPAGEATMRELEETLEAAVADAEAADALAAGHLATAMRYSGLGAASRRVATTSPKMDSQPARRGTATAPQRRRPPGGSSDKEAGGVRRQARTAVARAEREATGQARQRQRAMAGVERYNRAIGEAEDRLRSLRSERTRAQADLQKAERALEAAERRVADARKMEMAARAAEGPGERSPRR